MKQAFGYLRVSSPGQALDDRDGFDRQKEAIRRYADGNGMEVVQWFTDILPGKTPLENRPGMQSMLAALLENGVRLVLIERLDRFSRNLTIQEGGIAYLKRSGFEIISATEPDMFDDDPMRTAMRQMMGVFSELEAKMIALKLKGARARAKAKDPTWSEGRKPYGHRPGEQEVIRRILQLDAEGNKVAAICKILNDEGIGPRGTKHGVKEWTPQWMHQLLRKLKQSQG